MKIESRVPDINQEILSRDISGDATARRRSVTSGSSNDVSGKPIVTRAGVTEDEKKNTGPSIPEPIDVHGAIEKLNKIAEEQKKDVSFSVDEKSESTVIKVFRTQTGELIKQFPSEEILAMRARVRDNTSWFFDSKV